MANEDRCKNRCSSRDCQMWAGSAPDRFSLVWQRCGGRSVYLGSARNGVWGTSGDLTVACNEAVLSKGKGTWYSDGIGLTPWSRRPLSPNKAV